VRHAHEGDCASAIPLFESVLQRYSGLGWAAYDLGVCDEQVGQATRAVEAYRRALRAMPELEQASENLGRIYLRAGHAGSAEQALRSLIATYPRALGLHSALAEALEAEERYDAAANEAKLVLKGDEHNVAAMLRLASIYYHQKRFELSRMVTENAKQIDDSNPVVYNTLAFLDLADKNQILAIDDFKKAAELREDLPEVQNNLGALLVASQDYEEAIKHLTLAIRYAPDDAQAHVNLGNAYRGDKQNEQALQEYQKGLHLDSGLRDAYFDLGALLGRLAQGHRAHRHRRPGPQAEPVHRRRPEGDRPGEAARGARAAQQAAQGRRRRQEGRRCGAPGGPGRRQQARGFPGPVQDSRAGRR
jgi:tetratricopeptide (TPR) repeat protein